MAVQYFERTQQDRHDFKLEHQFVKDFFFWLSIRDRQKNYVSCLFYLLFNIMLNNAISINIDVDGSK